MVRSATRTRTVGAKHHCAPVATAEFDLASSVM